MKKIVFVLLCLLISASSFAGETTGYHTITRLDVYLSAVRVYITPDHEHNQCNLTNSVFIDTSSVHTLYAAVLLAYKEKKPVSFYLGACFTYSGRTAWKATRITVKDSD